MALKDFRVKNGLTVESGDITLTSGNINFSNGYMQTDNIKIDGNTISSTDSNGNINVTPNGTGYVMIDGIRWPNGGDSNGKFLQVDGSGHLSWVTVATSVVADTSPQLGGHLDTNNFKITATGSNDMVFEKDDGAFQFKDVDSANAMVTIGPSSMVFDFQTEGGASNGEAVLQYKDTGGTVRNFLTIDQNVLAFENRAANGIVEFYANTSTAGLTGRTHVMTIADTLITAKKNIKLDDANLEIDNNKGVYFYETNANGSHYGAIKFPASITDNFTLTFPGDEGGSGEVLTTNGSGVLSWTAKTVNTNTTYSTSVVDSSGIKLRLTDSGAGTDDVKFAGSGATSVARTDASTITISSTDTNTTYSEATSSAEGLMSTAHHDKLDGIEASATADQSNAEIRAAVEAASDSNVFTDADHTKLNGIATSANNYSISSDLLDEDNFATNSATKPASQQSIKAYVDAEVTGLVDSAPGALNTLNELAAALGDDASFSTTTATSLGNRLRIDVSNQGLTGTQKTNALTNLGITATVAELNKIDGYTGSSTELNYLDTLHATGVTNTEFDYLDGVTSNIQTQLDSKIGAVRAVTAGGQTLATSETLAFTAGTNVTITESGGAVTINSSASGDIADDSSPQLGGDLDLVTHDIVTTSNRDINLKPNGTGKVVITNTVDSATAGPILELLRDNDSGDAADDLIGQVSFKGSATAGGHEDYAQIVTRIQDNTQTSEDGALEFSVKKNGTLTKIFDIKPNLAAADPGFNIYGNTRLALWDDDSSNFVAIESPATVSSNYTLTLPADDGSANQVLKTDGNGALSWVDQSSGSVSAVANGGNNRIATFSSADALNGESTLTYETGVLKMDVGSGSGDDVAQVVLDGYVTASTNTISEIVVNNAGDSIGNMVWGRDGANDAGFLTFGTQPTSGNITERMRITSAGNVGIGVTTPSEKLEVDGSILVAYALAHLGDTNNQIVFTTDTQSFNTAGTNRMTIKSDGKIGIGTPAPTGKLTITDSGHDMIHLNRTVDNEGYGMGIIGRAGNSSSTTAAHEYAAMFFQIEDNTANSEAGSIAFNTSSGGTAADDGATHAMQITSAGKVGIGTTSPGRALSVRTESADHRIAQVNRAASDTAALYLGNDSSNNAWVTGNNADLIFGKDVAGTKTEYMRVDVSSGKVGVGVTNPYANLTVNNDFLVSSAGDTADPKVEGILHRITNTNNDNTEMEIFFVENHGLGYGFRMAFDGANNRMRFFTHNNSTSGSEVMRFDRAVNGSIWLGPSSNKVMVGTTNTPQSPLHVEQVSNTTFAASNHLVEHLLHLKCNSVTTNAFAGIAFDVSTETDTDSIGASISAVRDTSASSTAANHDANLVFSTNDAGDDGNTERMRITHDGNVGIGTNNPGYPLDVNGWISTASGIVHTGDTNNTIQFDTDIQKFNTAGTTRMMIDTDGEIGIGTTTVNGKLHIRDENDGSDQYSGIRFFPSDATTSATDTDAYHNITGFRKQGLMLAGGGLSGNYTRTYATLNNDGFKVFTNAGDNSAVNMSTQQRLLIPTGGGAATLSVPLTVTGDSTGSITAKVTNTHDTDTTGLAVLQLENQKGTDSSFYLEHNAYGQTVFSTGNSKNHSFTLEEDGDITLPDARRLQFGSTDTYIYATTDSNEHLMIAADGSIYLDPDADVFIREGSTSWVQFDGSARRVTVTGDFHATTKSFDIEHPTKEGMRLHHGSLEGPEHGVYVRGTLERENVIELPDYWEGLVDDETITVQLTAKKTFQQLYVERIEDNKVYVKELSDNLINCFYFVQAERKDVDKVKVEY